MARKFIRTTQQKTVDERGRQVETVQEREVIRSDRAPEVMNVYEAGSMLPQYYTRTEPVILPSNTWAIVDNRLEAQERIARQGSAKLNEIDRRLAYVEGVNQAWSAAESYGQLTWWALWGILMLILGSALAIVLVLIFTYLPR